MAKAKAASKKAKAATSETMVVIERPVKQVATVRIVGKTRLVCNKFPEKARRQISEKQAGIKLAKTKRLPRDDYEGSTYRLPSKKGKKPRYGFPCGGIKKAITAAGYRFFKIHMTESNGWFFIKGEPSLVDAKDGFSAVECVEIMGEPRMWTDMVHIGQGTSDLRYRAEFEEWHMDLEIEFKPDCIALQSLINLIDHAGDSVGIGEWRVEKKGDWGRFSVETAKG